MTHRRARPPIATALLLGLQTASAAGTATAATAAAQSAFMSSFSQQWRDHILAPAPRGPDGALQATRAAELPPLKPLALAELDAAHVVDLLAADASLDNWMPALTYHFSYPAHADAGADLGGSGSDWLSVQIEQGPLNHTAGLARHQRLPDWVAAALQTRLTALDQPAGTTRLPPGNARLLWAGEIDATEGDALIWSGPAVKHGVARYRGAGDHVVVRLASAPLHAAELVHWARRHGAPLRFTLDTAAAPLALNRPVPVRIDTTLRVWAVTPQALLPATLTALHTGGPCQGGDWIELELPGIDQPAIWGTLFLPDAALANAATVRRLPAEKPAADSPASMVSRVEVAWPERRLTGLLITAKEFGSVWGTQADVLVDDHGQPSARRLSGSGTPACGI